MGEVLLFGVGRFLRVVIKAQTEPVELLTFGSKRMTDFQAPVQIHNAKITANDRRE